MMDINTHKESSQAEASLLLLMLLPLTRVL